MDAQQKQDQRRYELAQRLVKREIYFNAQNTVAFVQEHDLDGFSEAQSEALQKDNEELFDYLVSELSWGTLHERLLDHIDEGDLFEDMNEGQDAQEYAKDQVCRYHADVLQEIQDDEGLYPEIYEYWFVSTWLARKLKVHGEAIIDHHAFDMPVWGRTTTGQGIASDEVIQEIAFDLWGDQEEETANEDCEVCND